MSILIKGMNMPSKDKLELFEEDNHIVIFEDDNFIVIGGHIYPIELDQIVEIPDALVSAWEDYKKTAQIIGKVGRKTFAHKVFELEAEGR